MTGIAADLTSLARTSALVDEAAGRLTAAPGGGTPAHFPVPGAARFLTAFTTARQRQHSCALGLSRYYSDAGAALTGLNRSLTSHEDAAARRFDRSPGDAA
ncbi:hypothetical protein [Corynebacterium provencense]|jgi:hypothetical protein|uniref:hypothetical protein n=1 Tax=Corynebacterium provencense TaxID=1737425 RepID=UPI00082DE005|nr:hypothetical protein [Corynebacterium provencense]MCI1256418.1 hypothetical protein [Corynebacterium provencense]